MELKITGRHNVLTDEVRDYAEEKLGRVERYDKRLRLLEVVIEDDKKQIRVEAKAHAGPGAPVVVAAHHAAAEGAIDRVHDLLERQLGRRKEKVRDLTRGKGPAAKSGTSAKSEPAAGSPAPAKGTAPAKGRAAPLATGGSGDEE